MASADLPDEAFLLGWVGLPPALGAQLHQVDSQGFHPEDFLEVLSQGFQAEEGHQEGRVRATFRHRLQNLLMIYLAAGFVPPPGFPGPREYLASFDVNALTFMQLKDFNHLQAFSLHREAEGSHHQGFRGDNGRHLFCIGCTSCSSHELYLGTLVRSIHVCSVLMKLVDRC